MEAFLPRYIPKAETGESYHVENQDYDMAMPVIIVRIKHFSIHSV